MEGLRRPLRWWREVLYVLAFYMVYSVIRNQFGSASVGPEQAFHNAEKVIRIERALGLFHEAWLQRQFLDWGWFIRFWNIFYGTFHFVVTGAALIWMYRSFPWRYALWRTTLAATTGLALIGFALFPLMPPRLLNVPTCPAGTEPTEECSPYGGGAFADEDFGFVDTLDEVGGLWSFDSGTMQQVSNQFAAMPSLHIGWAAWSACVLVPQLRRRWSRALAIAYPFLTLFCIIVTANHFWLDGVGGLVVFGAGFLLSAWLVRTMDARAAARRAPIPAEQPVER